MSRQYMQDSRSPTIGQTPSRNVPIKSTEAPATSSPLPHLLDGLRQQMEDDRREQDALVKTLKQMVKNVQRIRHRQDECWKHIEAELRNANAQPDDDGNASSQESRTQAWPYPGEDDDDEFHPLSDAEDTLPGPSRQPEARRRNPVGEGEEATSHQRPTIQSLVSDARSANAANWRRGSTDMFVDNMLDSFLQNDMDTDHDTARETTALRTDSASRMPTPITPGIRKAAAVGDKTAGPAPPTNEILDLTDVVSTPSPNPTSPAAGPSTASKTMPPPPTIITPKKTPQKKKSLPPSQAKRKRATDKTLPPSTSAEPRPKRMAASDGEKRIKVFYEFERMGAREQSQALGDENKSPFWNCGNCGTCVRCLERKRRLGFFTGGRMQ